MLCASMSGGVIGADGKLVEDTGARGLQGRDMHARAVVASGLRVD